MKKGDTIYVKEGPQLICKGIVQGPYKFDYNYRIIDANGYPWSHQVPVDWETNFMPINISLGGEPVTVLELYGTRLDKLKSALSIYNSVIGVCS